MDVRIAASALALVGLLAGPALADTDTDTDLPGDTDPITDTDTFGEQTPADEVDEDGGADCSAVASPAGLGLGVLAALVVVGRRRG